MPLDIFSLGLGFASGVAATGLAWQLTTRNVRNPESMKLTAVWALEEVSRKGPPAIMTERLTGLRVPDGSKIIVPQGATNAVPPAVLQSCEVRMHPDVGMNYALGKDRALVFSSFMHPRAHAVYTHEDATVKKLQGDFTRMWMEAEPYFERVRAADLAGMDGRHVEIAGIAAEVLEYRGRKMLRVSDDGHAVGVVTAQSDVARFQGKRVRVSGRVSRDGGYVFIEARRVESDAQATQAPTPRAA